MSLLLLLRASSPDYGTHPLVPRLSTSGAFVSALPCRCAKQYANREQGSHYEGMLNAIAFLLEEVGLKKDDL